MSKTDQNAISSTQGISRYQHALLDAMRENLLPLVTGKKKAAFGAVFKNHLLDLEGPKELDSKHTGRETHARKLFNGFTEIIGSLETLDDIELFVGKFPFRGTRVTKERYLQFNIECHLTEIYLLKERLDAYLALIQRQFKKDPRLRGIEKICKTLSGTVEATLKGVLNTRHAHIHSTRFNDEDISRLRTIALLSRSGSDELARTMQIYFKMEHSRIRSKWKDRICKNNAEIRKLLDLIFGAIYPIVFDEKTRKLNYPSRLLF